MGLPPVVAPQRRAARVALSHVDKVLVGPVGGEAAVLAHEDLGAPLSVGVLLVHAVDLALVGLQGAALRERLLTELTAVRTDTWQARRTASNATGERETFI